MAEQSNQAKSIFLEALEGHAPEQWPAFLEHACAGDPPLRAEVERLLRAQAEMGSFHEAPRAALFATVDDPVAERPGTVVGPYRLVQPIGEGGFGVVYLAEQQQPVRRKVALKVLKPGMDTREVIARFEAERQALAIMDHPHIANVLDGGETAGGRPYFVMELVKGVPITDFCDQNHLTLRQRLELFFPVCQAVQHCFRHVRGVR
jgi:serine/threonine protein kinase